GSPSRNTGKVDADCTSATQIGVLVSVVIIQAAATSFIHMQTLAISQVVHSRRKTGTLRGVNGPTRGGSGRRGGAGWSSGAIGIGFDCYLCRELLRSALRRAQVPQ